MPEIKAGLSSFSDTLRLMFSQMHVMTIIPMYNIIQTGLPVDFGSEAGFFGQLMKYNVAVSAINTFARAASFGGAYIPLEALVAEALFTMGKFWYYKFNINPQNYTMTHQKLVSEEETSDLAIINTYRNRAMNMSIRGNSGCILSRELLGLFDQQDSLPSSMAGAFSRYPKLSGAWIKFRQLERFFREINTDIAILFDMDIYIGKFMTFNYSMDANNPWVINYDMNFKIYPDMLLHTLSPSDYSKFFDAMYQRYGLSFVKTFEGKST